MKIKWLSHSFRWHFIFEKGFFKWNAYQQPQSALSDPNYYIFNISCHCTAHLSCKWIVWMKTMIAMQINNREPKQFESAIVSEVIGNFVCSSFNTFALSRTQAAWWMGRFGFCFFLASFAFAASLLFAQSLSLYCSASTVFIHCHLSCDLGRSSFIAIGRFTFYLSVLVSFPFVCTASMCPFTLCSRAPLVLLHRRTQSSRRLLWILCVFTLPRTLAACSHT